MKQAEATTRRHEVAYRARPWRALAVLLVGGFLLPLDFSIVNVAVPIVRAEFRATGGDLQLVFSLYATAYAALLVTGGRLGDLYGRKRAFVLGLAGFMAASVLCGLATRMGALLAGRLLQGMAAALMSPQVLALIRQIFPDSRRSRALGLYGAMVGLATIAGQLLGGLLVGVSWRAIFLVNLPIGFAVLAAAGRALPTDQRLPSTRLDLVGTALLSTGLLLLVFALTQGGQAGWPPPFKLALALSVPVLALFCWFESRLAAQGGQPLLALRLFRQRAFAVGIALSFLVYWFAPFFLSYALYLQDGAGWSPLRSGLAVIPFGAAFLTGSTNAARLVARFGQGAPAIGYALMLTGLPLAVLCLWLSPAPTPWLLAATVPVGFGMGVVLPSLVRIVLSEIEPPDAGMVSGVLNTVLQIGGAVSVAMVGSLFFGRLGTRPSLSDYAASLAAVCTALIAVYTVSLLLLRMLRTGQDENWGRSRQDVGS